MAGPWELPRGHWTGQPRVWTANERQRGVDAAFSVGVRSFPYLADHGFQDMVVLPGSFYVDLALSVHRERFGRASATVRNAIFQSPIILSNEDTQVTVEVTDRGTFVEYVFYEHVRAARSSGLPARAAASSRFTR